MLPLTFNQNIQNTFLKNIYTYKLYTNNKEFREDFSAKMFVKKNFQMGFNEVS